MTANTAIPGCEVLQQLKSEQEAMSRALHKAHDILGRPSESPDTLRRRRNSIKRWNEVYAAACERLAAHTREHKCSNDSDAPAS